VYTFLFQGPYFLYFKKQQALACTRFSVHPIEHNIDIFILKRGKKVILKEAKKLLEKKSAKKKNKHFKMLIHPQPCTQKILCTFFFNTQKK
jgi:hypothetical protein